MKTWTVRMEVTEDITVEAETEDEASDKAAAMFDPYAHDFIVVEVYEVTQEN